MSDSLGVLAKTHRQLREAAMRLTDDEAAGVHLAALDVAGFTIVPKVPTVAMIEAAVMTFVRENGGIEHAPAMTWRAMLTAAGAKT